MNQNIYDFDRLRNLAIGMVHSVSPNEIGVSLETNAPQNTSLNTGVPSLFPRINSFVLIPNEVGALVGLISWLGVEHSQYPKRKGFKDYDLIDLPFPLRKMSINPVGTLKRDIALSDTRFILERGVYSFPSIGDTVILPSDEQLKSIVENDDINAHVKVGTAPIAANASVKINPDKLFGRHLAVLGNTGSGKSCSVAGLIRWSLEAASSNLSPQEVSKQLNSRFILLDPNGEYSQCFDDLNTNVKRYKVEISDDDKEKFKQLKVPAWFWNSYEWSSFSQASGKSQRPILRRALRELKNDFSSLNNDIAILKRQVTVMLASIGKDLNSGVDSLCGFPGNQNFGEKLITFGENFNNLSNKAPEDYKTHLNLLSEDLSKLALSKKKTKGYFHNFSLKDAEEVYAKIKNLFDNLPITQDFEGYDEDSPTPFDTKELPEHIELLAEEQGAQQFLDLFIMRIKSLLNDKRIDSIIGKDEEQSLENWLNEYLTGMVIIDLSLVPSDILHLIVSVISRMVFEATQRYRKKYNKVIPTVLVLEEAHNFIKKYSNSDEITASEMCSKTFEKIAKEGRKFGLSLMLSSQRPSELSSTVLSQCNTFLLHRIVNDRDQDLVRRLVPDNIGGLLQELPILPTRKAILLGWSSPIPMLVEMNKLEKKYRPDSNDPDFWNVWTRKASRLENWNEVAKDWN
ncbi:MAG: ATP-binding protein [Candidatus Caenarcaniphilales bacterium]|nr:ATP-binding protein [Candidatus Caenarcaniphilales bacterium]